MSASPDWMKALSEPSQPHLGLRGASRGAMEFMDHEQGLAAVKAGTHLNVTGRDMTSIDIDAEIAEFRSKAKEAPATDATETSSEPKAQRVARVGRYANRALVTKPGEGK